MAVTKKTTTKTAAKKTTTAKATTAKKAKTITKDIKLKLYQGKYIIGVNLIEDFKVSTDKKIRF